MPKRKDHYKAICSTVLNHREQVDNVLGPNGARW